jgi:hypothetical protein
MRKLWRKKYPKGCIDISESLVLNYATLTGLCLSTPTRYKLLAEIIVDEMRIMRMNVLRLQAVHNLFGPKKWWFLPRTLKDFEKKTEWTHVLSARFSHVESCLSCILYDAYLLFAAQTAKNQMRTLKYGMGSKVTSGQAR